MLVSFVGPYISDTVGLKSCLQLGSGTANFTESPALVQQYIQRALSALSAQQLSPPQIDVKGSTTSSNPALAAVASSFRDGAGAPTTFDAMVSCRAPAGDQDVVPAVLWELTARSGVTGTNWLAMGFSVPELAFIRV